MLLAGCHIVNLRSSTMVRIPVAWSRAAKCNAIVMFTLAFLIVVEVVM